MRVSRTLSWIAAVGFTASAAAQFDSGSDGSDGAFTPSDAETVIDLAAADTGAWDDPAKGNGNGVYDPDVWAVVFQYSMVTIPAGVTVKFENHPSGAPVVWLASEDVTIQGGINVDGSTAAPDGYEVPGPGGFAGGGPAPPLFSPGFGPGGGNPGQYAGAYGNPVILPLIGGSGGYGGAGGGAILIASSGEIGFLVGGTITSLGGDIGGPSGDGSGGGIRLIANSISGPGNLQAQGGPAGRIRLEAFDLNGFNGTRLRPRSHCTANLM